MEIDDTFKNKSSATFGKKRITHLKGKEKKVPMCQNRAFIYCPIYYSLSKISISLTFLLVPFIRHAVEELWKFCATQGVSWVTAITKSLPRLRAKLARFSVVSAFKYYCNVIVLLEKGEHGKSRAKR